MSSTQYLNKYTRSFLKDSSATNTAQVVAAGATVTVYKQGCTVTSGTTVTTSPTVVTVRDSGRLAVSDTVQVGTDATLQMTTTAVTSGTSITLQSTTGSSINLNAGDRLVIYSNKPTLYTENTGISTTPNPTTANSRGGIELYTTESILDVIVSGTGLTSALYANEASGWYRRINVRDYGALGDGATNDTTAVALALASVPTAGGEVYFPPGTYVITTTLTPQSKTRLFGAGSSSILKDGTGNMSIVALTGKTDIQLDSLSFTGSGSLSVAARGAIFATTSIARCRISNCYIFSVGTCGISLASATESSISGNTITSTKEHGIYLDTATGVTIDANTLYSCGSVGSGTQSAIHLTNSTKIVVSNNIISAPEHVGIRLTGATANCAVSGNSIMSAPSQGILLNIANICVVTGNVVQATTSHGIRVGSTSATNVIVGNTVIASGTNDILIDAGPTDTQIINNYAVTVGISDAGTRTTIAGNKTNITDAYYNISSDVNLATGKALRVAGIQLLTNQGALVADVAAGGTVDTNARTTINAVLARLRAHGIIAT